MDKEDVQQAVDAAVGRTRLLGPTDLAAEVGVPLATVYRWNHTRTGPRFIRLGKHVRYRRVDVDAWLEANVSDPRRAS